MNIIFPVTKNERGRVHSHKKQCVIIVYKNIVAEHQGTLIDFVMQKGCQVVVCWEKYCI